MLGCHYLQRSVNIPCPIAVSFVEGNFKRELLEEGPVHQQYISKYMFFSHVCITICFCVINHGEYYFLHNIEFSAETMLDVCIFLKLQFVLIAYQYIRQTNVNCHTKWF